MDRDTALLGIRWRMALERYIADYAEPGSPSGYYSLRTSRKFKNKRGREFKPDPRHGTVWASLVAFAHDLEKSVTHTWAGKERLKQLSGLSATTYSEVLDDLEAMSFITIGRRLNQTNQINLHLVPVDPENPKDYVIQPVTIATEELGFYVCQAAKARGESFTNEAAPDLPDEVGEVMKLLRDVFTEHPSFTTSRQRAALQRYISGCIKMANYVEFRCFYVLHGVLSDASPDGLNVIEKIGHSKSLGAYIQTCFPTWLVDFNAKHSTDKVIDSL